MYTIPRNGTLALNTTREHHLQATSLIISNRKCGRAVIYANTTLTQTAASLQTFGETVTGLTLAGVFFSGQISIANSTATVLSANGTDHWILSAYGAAVPNMDEIVITVTSGSCTVLIDKIATLNANTASQTGYYVNP